MSIPQEKLDYLDDLLDSGNIVLHAIKRKLDEAKEAYDGGRICYEAGEYEECLVLMAEATEALQIIPPMIIGTLTEESDE